MTQHENLPPSGYVQALPTVTHGDRIEPGIRTTALTAGSYPTVIRAMNLIREDNGGPSWPPESEPLVATRWLLHLDRIERALAGLSDSEPAPEDTEALLRVESGEGCYLDSELYNFCNGESTVMDAIKGRTPALTLANHFLNDFFEGWSWYADEGFDPSVAPAQDNGEQG